MAYRDTVRHGSSRLKDRSVPTRKGVYKTGPTFSAQVFTNDVLDDPMKFWNANNPTALRKMLITTPAGTIKGKGMKQKPLKVKLRDGSTVDVSQVCRKKKFSDLNEQGQNYIAKWSMGLCGWLAGATIAPTSNVRQVNEPHTKRELTNETMKEMLDCRDMFKELQDVLAPSACLIEQRRIKSEQLLPPAKPRPGTAPKAPPKTPPPKGQAILEEEKEKPPTTKEAHAIRLKELDEFYAEEEKEKRGRIATARKPRTQKLAPAVESRGSFCKFARKRLPTPYCNYVISKMREMSISFNPNQYSQAPVYIGDKDLIKVFEEIRDGVDENDKPYRNIGKVNFAKVFPNWYSMGSPPISPDDVKDKDKARHLRNDMLAFWFELLRQEAIKHNRPVIDSTEKTERILMRGSGKMRKEPKKRGPKGGRKR